jgi:hypothetical protein
MGGSKEHMRDRTMLKDVLGGRSWSPVPKISKYAAGLIILLCGSVSWPVLTTKDSMALNFAWRWQPEIYLEHSRFPFLKGSNLSSIFYATLGRLFVSECAVVECTGVQTLAQSTWLSDCRKKCIQHVCDRSLGLGTHFIRRRKNKFCSADLFPKRKVTLTDLYGTFIARERYCAVSRFSDTLL